MTRKKKFLILAACAVAGVGFFAWNSGAFSKTPEVVAEPTPPAEMSLYVTFDDNGGYTVLDSRQTDAVPADVKVRAKDDTVKKHLISFYPDIITLFGDYTATTLHTASTLPNKTGLFSCFKNAVTLTPAETFDINSADAETKLTTKNTEAKNENTQLSENIQNTESFEKFEELLVNEEIADVPEEAVTSRDIFFYEIPSLTGTHIFEKMPGFWLTELKKEALFYHHTSELGLLPEETRRSLAFTERLLTNCLEIKTNETEYKLRGIDGKTYPVSRIDYNININNSPIILASSLVAKIGERFLEICYEPQNLTDFKLNVDISLGAEKANAKENVGAEEANFAPSTEESQLMDMSDEEVVNSLESDITPESISEGASTENLSKTYTTYDEYVSVVVPQIYEDLSVLSRSEICPEILDDLILGDYNVIAVFEPDGDEPKNEAASETKPEDTLEEKKPFTLKNLLKKIPFLNKKTSEEDTQEKNTEN